MQAYLHSPMGAWALGTLLLSMRIGAVLVVSPLLSQAMIPATARVLLVMSLSIAIAAGLSSGDVVVPETFGHLVSAFLREAAVGVVLGLGVLVAFATFTLAGRFLDVQIGFGIAQVFDPLTKQQVPVLTSLLNLTGVVVFFSSNGHHALLRGIQFSTQALPVGMPRDVVIAAFPLIGDTATLFGLGFSMAAPIVLSLMLVEVALGVISRNLPQINMFVLGIPLKVIVGLLTLALWLPAAGWAFSRIYAKVFGTWEVILFNVRGVGG